MPWSKFEAIKTPADLIEFFETTFADALNLIGREALVADYFKNEKGSLMTIKVFNHVTFKVQTLQL